MDQAAEDLLEVAQAINSVHNQINNDEEIRTEQEKKDLGRIEQQVKGPNAEIDSEDSGEDSELEEQQYDITTGSVWSFISSCGINLILPFINGIMLGFGEILAHEIGFRYNWSGARVVPARRNMLIQSTQADIKNKKSTLFG